MEWSTSVPLLQLSENTSSNSLSLSQVEVIDSPLKEEFLFWNENRVNSLSGDVADSVQYFCSVIGPDLSRGVTEEEPCRVNLESEILFCL